MNETLQETVEIICVMITFNYAHIFRHSQSLSKFYLCDAITEEKRTYKIFRSVRPSSTAK